VDRRPAFLHSHGAASLADRRRSVIVREHGRQPRLVGHAAWHGRGRTETGQVRAPVIAVKDQQTPWRRIALALEAPTEDGETTIRLWSNPPEAIGAGRITALYRTRWRIAGMSGRLASGLNSEMTSLGHPRAALLGCAVPVLACNVLTLIQRCVEQAHQRPHEPSPEVSTCHRARPIRSSFQGLLIAVPAECWPAWHKADPCRRVEPLLCLARPLDPRQVVTSKRKPRPKTPKGDVDAKAAHTHVATARVRAQARTRP
jgi:hypothetical protein